MDELTREFLIESQEGLDRMERCLTELEERPQDAGLIGDIFRSVHTIKGTTGFLGFTRLEKLAHAGENLLGMLREGKLTADGPITTGLLQLLDGLRSILKCIEVESSEGEGGDAELIGRLEELQVPSNAMARAAAVKGAAVEARGAPGECLGVPEPVKAASETAQAGEIHAAVAAENGLAKAGVPKTAAVVAGKARPAPHAEPESGMTEMEAAKPRAAAVGTAAESTLRVDVALLNRLMNLVGELVLTRNQVLQATAAYPALTALSRRLDMVTSDLRESVMKARMQPVSNIFSKMPRIVRDLSQMLGRRVRLEVEGQETELDKSLLEAIKDPLTHAVRNSLDHGIESPEVRAAAGKNPEGTLRLRALQEGSHVVIEVADDGAGISVDKVRQKAVDKGLITLERAAQLAGQELLQLVFLPGFSTAAAVTNVSGRGVGMDVVKTNVEKIGGKVEIESGVGRGTTLRLRIPLTLAIIPALIVRSVGQSFALPQGALSELVHVPPEEVESIEWMEDAPLYRLRGKLLPLVFLDRMLRPETIAEAWRERDNYIAVLNVDGRQLGLVVDGLADPEEIVVKPLSAVLKTIGLYSGATVLGNAEMALILDPGAIAVRAGVAMSVAAKGGTHAGRHGGEDLGEETDEDAAKTEEYLLVEVAERRAAVPLDSVLRIEQIKAARVEYIGYRPVLNFEGQLLPVEDAGELLRAKAADPEAKIVVVVCREGGRQVGIAVSHVLDVAAGGPLFEAGTTERADGVMLLKSRVTTVVKLGGVPAFSMEPAESDGPEAVLQDVMERVALEQVEETVG